VSGQPRGGAGDLNVLMLFESEIHQRAALNGLQLHIRPVPDSERGRMMLRMSAGDRGTTSVVKG
jgi:hypothetical protein